MKQYKVLGRNDEQTTCDCCGKMNLKLTVILEDNETGETVRYGVNCAAKAMGRDAKYVKNELVKVRNHEMFVARQAMLERNRIARANGQPTEFTWG